MKIEQLRPNIGTLPADEAFHLFNDYCFRRIQDLEMSIVMIDKPKKKKAKGPKAKPDEVKVSPADLEILKKLGLV